MMVMMMMAVVVALKAAILDLTAGTVVKATTTTTTAITENSNNNNNANLKPKKSCLRRSRRSLRDFYDSSLKHTHLFCGHTFLGEQQQAARKQVTLWALDVCSLLFCCSGGVGYSLTV